MSRPPFLTTFQYDHLDMWQDATDKVDWQMPPLQIYRELVARAPDYRGVILMGSTGAKDLYFSQVAAARIGRRGVPVVLAECIWETYSRRFTAQVRDQGYDAPRREHSGVLSRRILSALDTPLTHYGVLSHEETESFPQRWGVAPDRVHMTGYFASLQDDRYVGPGPGGVFGGGNSLRDWRTLVAIAPQLDVPVQIATALLPPTRRGNLTVSALSESDYDEVARRATVVVVSLRPNTQRSSGQQTYLNAMLQGKPVVVTDAMGVRDHIEHGRTGLIVPPDDLAALRTTLRDLLADPERCRKLGAAAREAVLTRFNLERYLSQLLEIANQAAAAAR